MNVERLHAVARAAKGEMESLSVPTHLDALVQSLQGLANQPADGNAQAQISERRVALQQLSNAPSNMWPSSDRQVAEDIGLDDQLGSALLERIESVLTQNEMTPAVAASELTPIAEQVRTSNARLATLIEALDYFEVGVGEPKGEAEIVFAIPRDAVNSDLATLAREFDRIWKILAPFQELATGSRGGMPVESISASAFGLELLAGAGFAYLVARAINEILTVYKNVLEIREARNRLKAAGMPDDALSSVDSYANEAIGQRNNTLADEIMASSPLVGTIEEHRANELKVELTLSLNSIANRIDRGYDMDVRAPAPPEEAAAEGGEGGPETEAQATASFQRHIREISPNLRAGRPGGGSILSLPEGPIEDDPAS